MRSREQPATCVASVYRSKLVSYLRLDQWQKGDYIFLIKLLIQTRPRINGLLDFFLFNTNAYHIRFIKFCSMLISQFYNHRNIKKNQKTHSREWGIYDILLTPSKYATTQRPLLLSCI